MDHLLWLLSIAQRADRIHMLRQLKTSMYHKDSCNAVICLQDIYISWLKKFDMKSFSVDPSLFKIIIYNMKYEPLKWPDIPVTELLGKILQPHRIGPFEPRGSNTLVHVVQVSQVRSVFPSYRFQDFLLSKRTLNKVKLS